MAGSFPLHAPSCTNCCTAFLHDCTAELAVTACEFRHSHANGGVVNEGLLKLEGKCILHKCQCETGTVYTSGLYRIAILFFLEDSMHAPLIRVTDSSSGVPVPLRLLRQFPMRGTFIATRDSATLSKRSKRRSKTLRHAGVGSLSLPASASGIFPMPVDLVYKPTPCRCVLLLHLYIVCQLPRKACRKRDRSSGII